MFASSCRDIRITANNGDVVSCCVHTGFRNSDPCLFVVHPASTMTICRPPGCDWQLSVQPAIRTIQRGRPENSFAAVPGNVHKGAVVLAGHSSRLHPLQCAQ